MRVQCIYTQWLLTILTVALSIQVAHADDGDALTGSVRGRVVTSDGQPASYVTITLKGSQKGTLSTEDGSYVLRHLPAG